MNRYTLNRWIDQITFWGSAAIVTTVIGGLIWLGEPPPPPPDGVTARVATADITRHGARIIVPVLVQNNSRRTVLMVQVRVRLDTGDAVELTIDPLAAGASARAYALFDGVQDQVEVSSQVIAFQPI